MFYKWVTGVIPLHDRTLGFFVTTMVTRLLLFIFQDATTWRSSSCGLEHPSSVSTVFRCQPKSALKNWSNVWWNQQNNRVRGNNGWRNNEKQIKSQCKKSVESRWISQELEFLQKERHVQFSGRINQKHSIIQVVQFMIQLVCMDWHVRKVIGKQSHKRSHFYNRYGSSCCFLVDFV